MAMTTYAANCHCGRIQFTATLPDILATPVVRCNCSICTKNGYLLAYARTEDVRFVVGGGRMGKYCFGRKRKPHKFCVLCGTSVLVDNISSDAEGHGEGGQGGWVAVNVRTFDVFGDVVDRLTIRDVDGKNLLQPQYSVPRVLQSE
ncbi:hypothetical protein UCDDS831_g05914 [Diplodia seriata]|uniref:CENP-V/GFA domain-containing protein n=1 Tax=Diplodia seriata TaxID=420778 RepID=A0A0G2E6H5_9PEZI|nr:hypothetical protein UCDDS831_g05914 [Diplodia seriata]